MTKVDLSFAEISQRLHALTLPAVDLVVGIATGGIVPASLVAHQLGKPLTLLQINYRAVDNTPRHPEPILLSSADLPTAPRRILLVDDVSVSGKTLDRAKGLLSDHTVTTLVMKGRGDFVLFPEVAACVNWPWQVHTHESGE